LARRRGDPIIIRMSDRKQSASKPAPDVTRPTATPATAAPATVTPSVATAVPPVKDGPSATVTAATGKPDGAKDGVAKEIGGPAGPEPTRYGDWEIKGRCVDF
jgi:hypothetical protein